MQLTIAAMPVTKCSICRLMHLQRKQLMPVQPWFNCTTRPIAQSFSRLVCCWHQRSMVASAMDDTEEVALQMAEVFKHVMPMFDTGLKLEPDPRNPKRCRDQKRPENREAHVPRHQTQETQQLASMMRLMATVLIRQDQDLQSLKRNDSFVLFFSKEPSGTLAQMTHAATQWKAQQEIPGASPMKTPLRCHLMSTLLSDLLKRVTEVSKAKPEDALYQATVRNQIMLEDYSWPFLQWNNQKKNYQIANKKAIGMKQMLDLCQELQELFLNPVLVSKFHALQNKPDSQIVPWRLQLHLRLDTAYEILTNLSHNGVWALLGTQLKPHLQSQSPLVMALQGMMGKGKGKGKALPNGQDTKEEQT